MNMSPNEQIEQVLALLTEAHTADPQAINALLCVRVDCNSKLVDHPTIPVRLIKVGEGDDIYEVGALGLINGIVERLTGRKIAVITDENRSIVGFAGWVKDEEGNES